MTFVINPYITLKFLENSQCFKASPLVLCIYCKINAARGITCKIHKNSHYCSFVQFAKQVVNKTLSRQAKIFFNLWLVFLASHNDLFKNREIDLQCFKKNPSKNSKLAMLVKMTFELVNSQIRVGFRLKTKKISCRNRFSLYVPLLSA